ncbi:LOW QUALITY PROTEIN: rRNA N6-adenosine-methyltransferase ZCCHC4-like [Uloborus diversus]|uniref:LOW QUALITY PROTEIN: rRNA N6-adenosine-methyltransferase ZCCHC4-like n=1 Tax=Uloborus diversus TaxID=327109 RepID=UPI0024093C1B|nr:LOW QUALITY PROTEIN: rRNA N6-adenosine-methyltransferase ZCCHC4-like [Uloborus diversus]
MEVILENLKNNPHCPHGPCLIFERYSSNGTKTGRRFFACSACRDRSDCSFFQWVDDDLSTQTKEHWRDVIEKHKPPFTHEEYLQRLEKVKSSSQEKRKYCKTCSLLVLEEEESLHLKHDFVSNLTLQDLQKPSCIFETVQNKKAEAQYFFAKETVEFVVNLVEKLGFTKLVLLGVPKVHEYVQENSNLNTFLMDIDYRYMQFFSPNKFCHYNIFNNYFFNGAESKTILKEFLSEQSGEKVAVMLDPPFGGLVDAIACTLKKLNKWWRKKNEKSTENLPFMWFFPYFMEGRIVKSLPDAVMMDYKVEYTNHKKFGTKVDSKGSPVRIFTNIMPSAFVLPESLGYRFCEKCERFIAKENKHCVKCNCCTTKHGKTYKHCDECKQCVKNSYEHCGKCKKCNLIGHVCSESTQKKSDGIHKQEKCHKCSGFGHRKRNCPVNTFRNRKKMRHMC